MAGVTAVVFDFDLTLADSLEPVTECINYGLRGLGLPEASQEDIARTIGLHLSDALVVLAGEEQKIKAERFVKLFAQRADVVMADNTRIYSAVPEALRGLKDSGYRLGIVSTKYRYRIEDILKRDGLLDIFDDVVGGEDVQRHKPAPDALCLALSNLGAGRQEAVYVGDSVTDAMTAQAAGVRFVAVLSGVTKAREFDPFPTWATLPRVERRHLQELFERNPDGHPQRS